MFGRLDKETALQLTDTPRFREIPYENPLEVFSKLDDNYNYIYLLESVEGPQKLAQFSFIGFSPKKVIAVKNGITTIIEGKGKSVIRTSNPLEIIKEEVYANRAPHNRFRLIGGAVGYISYDAIRYWENLPHTAIDNLNLPDVEMGI